MLNMFKCISRPFSSSGFNQSGVRVRFAPSPTGSLHLGGLRTAFYNFIFARKYNGSFILRIEDTDQSRTVNNSIEEIHRILDWAGLVPDESPKHGGDFGPYIQSQRLGIYRNHINQLFDSDKVYRCFCNPLRLDLIRKTQLRNREKPRYDGICRHLSKDEISSNLKSGKPFTVRFKLTSGLTSFDDLVFGQINNDLVGSDEGDPIIMKSDGWPTYHFANVVDDHEMQISHVFRGSEWIPSTPKHIQLYQAFGWPTPTFAHLPLISMNDGSKMSKRNDQAKVTSYIERGFRPDATLNLLTNFGGGLPKEKQDANILWDIETIIDNFQFEKITSHQATIDPHRLNIYNQLSLRKQLSEDPNHLIQEIKLKIDSKPLSYTLNDNQIKIILDHFLQDRVYSLNDLFSGDYNYLWEAPENYAKLKDSVSSLGVDVLMMIDKVNDVLIRVDLEDKVKILDELKKISQNLDVQWPKFMKMLRLMLTGCETGQPVYEILICLGKARTIEYLKNVKNNFNK